MTPADIILARLDRVRPSGHDKWIARCPAHQDNSPSLSIKRADNEAILIHCHAGCDAAAITAALGLNLADLFPPRPADVHSVRPRASTLTPLAMAFERDLIITTIVLGDVAAGKPISNDDKITAKAAATRLWAALEKARHVC